MGWLKCKRKMWVPLRTLTLVGVTGFEPAASTSQTSRATNCATPRCVIFIWLLFFLCAVKTVRTLIGRGLYYSKVFFDCQVCGEKSIENFPALSCQGFFRGGLIRDDCPPPLSEIAQDRPHAFIRLFAIVKVKKQTHQGGYLQKDVSDFLFGCQNYLQASSISTATVIPTMGLLPAPMNFSFKYNLFIWVLARLNNQV